MPAARIERFQDRVLLDRFQIGCRCGFRDASRRDREGKIGCGDFLVLSQNRSFGNDIAEFANIARPGLGFEIDEHEAEQNREYEEELGGEFYDLVDGSIADW